MPETAYDELYHDGQLISRTPRIISDADILRRDAPTRLRQSYAALRQWQTDAMTTVGEWDALTQAQKNARLKIVIQRFGLLCDGVADLLLAQAMDS